MTNLINYFSCPNCKNTIQNNIKKDRENSLHCINCSQKWNIKNYRPIFTSNYDDYDKKPTASPSIVRERLNPRIYDFTFIMTRAYRRFFNVFLKNIKSQHSKILDIGCGFKPFSNLFSRNNEYIGVDISLNSYADVIADNHNLPFLDNVFDTIILSESLEHATNEYILIDEIKRVSRNGALIFTSIPFIFPEHGTPFDFQRLTKYKLQELFKNDEIILLKESNNFISTLFVLPNIFLKTASTTRLRILFYPIFIINNAIALLNEIFWYLFITIKNKYHSPNPYLEKILNSCPIGYAIIVKIKK